MLKMEKLKINGIMILVILFVLLLGFSSFVIAYNASGTGGNPPTMGHSVDELFPVCLEGQLIKKVSGLWDCADDLS